MKLLRFSVYLAVALLSVLAFGSCSKVEEPDWREHDYGYVQFKLYKEVSYTESKAVVSQLDYLSRAKKIMVIMTSEDGNEIRQTLTLGAADDAKAEYGLRSEKLKLVAGTYTVNTYTLYDIVDEELYKYDSDDKNDSYKDKDPGSFTVVAGGLQVHDLTANVTPRGHVRFTLVKDIQPETKAAAADDFTFDEIKRADVVVKNVANGLEYRFSIPAKFQIGFDESKNPEQDYVYPEKPQKGWQNSYAVCDTLVSLPAGTYKPLSYVLYSSDKKTDLLGENDQIVSEKNKEFTVTDNQVTEADVPVVLTEAAEYIKDYYALKAIWEALGGEDWYYIGENFNNGANWDFNKDVDLWGDQPGVQLHANGRVALIDLSNFGFYGEMPEAIGQCTELIELYLGTHNDTNLYTYGAKQYSSSLSSASRMQKAKEYLRSTHPATQFSEPIARAMMEKGVSIPEIEMYEKYTEDEIIEKGTGMMKVRPMDTNPGTIVNGLTKLPESIGNLKNLQKICIANSELAELPASFAQLESCTDLELYNLPNMKEFPVVLAHMPALVQLNLSSNPQWGETLSDYVRHDGTNGNQADLGLDALAYSDGNDEDGTYLSYKTLQMIYMNECGLSEVTRNMSNLKSLGLLSLSSNKIDKVYPFGSDIVMVQLYMDNNRLTEIPIGEDGVFCGMDDVENLSFSNNLLTELPDIFTAKSKFIMKSVDFSSNRITKVQNGDNYKGINVETLSLTNNPLEVFPVEFKRSGSRVAYYNMRGCRLHTIPEEAFELEGGPSEYLASLDLSYNDLKDLPSSFNASHIPYLYGLELSYNEFSSFPYEPLSCYGLTVFGIRGQRNKAGERCLSEWPTGIYQHVGLRGFYIGSNNLGKIDDTISPICYYLEVSDNPNLILDASNVCYEYSIGAYYLIYDKTQDIRGCDLMKM